MHTLCINGAQESPDEIIDFPTDITRTVGDGDLQLTYVDGLEETLTTCYDSNLLPSEIESVTWAQAARWVDLCEYRQFPSDAAD
jgi:hypothetical protein